MFEEERDKEYEELVHAVLGRMREINQQNPVRQEHLCLMAGFLKNTEHFVDIKARMRRANSLACQRAIQDIWMDEAKYFLAETAPKNTGSARASFHASPIPGAVA